MQLPKSLWSAEQVMGGSCTSARKRAVDDLRAENASSVVSRESDATPGARQASCGIAGCSAACLRRLAIPSAYGRLE